MSDKIESFTEVTNADIAFGRYPKDFFDSVLAMPEDKEWSKKASKIFFSGGTLDLDQSLPKEYLDSGIRMLECILGSFDPKHEHKEHVAGLIMKNLCKKGD